MERAIELYVVIGLIVFLLYMNEYGTEEAFWRGVTWLAYAIEFSLEEFSLDEYNTHQNF